MPTTAINMFNPTLFNTQSEGSGIPPKVGCLLRSQPNISPAINAPPLVERLIGTPPRCIVNAPIRPPTRIPSPTKIISVWFVGRSTYPICLAAVSTSCFIPVSSRISPASTTVRASTGTLIPARLILRILTPCINFCARIVDTFSPAKVRCVTITGRVSAGKSSSCASITSGPIQSSSPITNSRRPLSTISSSGWRSISGLTSFTTPRCRTRSTNNSFSCSDRYFSSSLTFFPLPNHLFVILYARNTTGRRAGENPGSSISEVPILDSSSLQSAFTLSNPPRSFGPREARIQAEPAVPKI